MSILTSIHLIVSIGASVITIVVGLLQLPAAWRKYKRWKTTRMAK